MHVCWLSKIVHPGLVVLNVHKQEVHYLISIAMRGKYIPTVIARARRVGVHVCWLNKIVHPGLVVLNVHKQEV